jgi:ribosomal protein L20
MMYKKKEVRKTDLKQIWKSRVHRATQMEGLTPWKYETGSDVTGQFDS